MLLFHLLFNDLIIVDIFTFCKSDAKMKGGFETDCHFKQNTDNSATLSVINAFFYANY